MHHGERSLISTMSEHGGKLTGDDFDRREEPANAAPKGSPLADLIDYASKRELSITTAALAWAAERRRISCRLLTAQGLLVLGDPPHVRLLNGTLTSNTVLAAVQLAEDKYRSGQILSAVGLPVPSQKIVDSARGAVICAETMGYPVVVKPFRGSHGRGVSINLTTSDAVRLAFAGAAKYSARTLVEKYLFGAAFRLLVIDNNFVAGALLKPPTIVGDGIRTVKELISIENANPRRGTWHENVLTFLTLDTEVSRVIQNQGYFADSVPHRGSIITFRDNSNLSTGGLSIDVTDNVHSDNKDVAVRAVQTIGLDIGGVDFITTDISQSYRTTGGAICEVNASPGLRMHIAPAEGDPRNVAEAIITMLFPDATDRAGVDQG
jgi:cyanophycin synthetase